ncbi:MAG TPA: hypothetical protein VJN44_02500 [Roseateles sp.]|nr:hypothetical protein [Roseateles sp.]
MQSASMRALSSAAVLGLFAVTVGAQEAGRVFTPAELKLAASPRAHGMQTLDLLGDSAQPGPAVQIDATGPITRPQLLDPAYK